MLEAVRRTLGEYAVTLDRGALLRQPRSNVGGPRADLMALRGVRFATVSEVARGQTLDSVALKEFTGGDTLTTRGMYAKDQTEFIVCAKLWAAMNHLPKADGDDFALWRRVCIVPFARAIPLARIDRDLPAELDRERSGNSALDGPRLLTVAAGRTVA